MASRLAPDVVHQGIKPEWICHNRQEVIDMVGQRVGRVPPVEAIELVAAGDHVVMHRAEALEAAGAFLVAWD
jgi:hypothetical protein